MAKFDEKYNELLNTIFQQGYKYDDPNRKGVRRLQIDDYRFEHSFSDGFPALTTKKIYFRGAIGELLCFLAGKTNIKDLHNYEVKFWDKDGYNFYVNRCQQENWEPLQFEEWKREALYKSEYWWESDVRHRNAEGDLGKIYPYQMRHWNGRIDQFYNLIQTLKNNPMSTKKTVTMWNPSDLKDCALSPCHWAWEALVRPLSLQERTITSGINWFFPADEEELDIHNIPKYGLTIKWHQHSTDSFLGMPLNTLYYSALCYLIGKICNMKPLGIIADLSNVHLYDNQITAAKEQMSRATDKYSNPTLELNSYIIDKYTGAKEDLMSNPIDDYEAFNNMLNNIQIDDFELKGYQSYPNIKVEMLPYNK